MIKWWQMISTKHPWRVVVVASVVILGLGWYASGLFGDLSSSSAGIYVDTKATVAQKKIEEKFGVSPLSQIILFERKDPGLGEANGAVYQAEASRVLAPLKDKVKSITSYSTQPSNVFISKDKTASYAVVVMEGSSEEIYKVLTNFAEKADQSKLKISVGGEAASQQQTVDTAEKELIRIEMVTLPILLLLLLVFFRSGIAALIPLGMGVLTIVGAFAITRIFTMFLPIDSYAVNVITILGVGLSIDYALLSVNRFREELVKNGVENAVKTIISTSGMTIVFSGITVVACLLSLLVFPIEMMRNIAIGGTSAVVMGVLVTIVILPSFLMIIGKRIDKWQIPFWRNQAKGPSETVWGKIASFTTTYPVRTLVVGLVVVGVMLVPLAKFSPGTMDYKWLASDSSSYYVSKFMSDRFDIPSTGLSALLVLPGNTSMERRMDVSCDFTDRLMSIDGVSKVISPTPVSAKLPCSTLKQLVLANAVPAELQAAMSSNMRDEAMKFDVILRGEVGSADASKVLAAVRSLKPSSGEVFVGGPQANFEDINRLYYDAIPWALFIIILSMLVLLSLSLRSVVIPVQSILINSIALCVSMAFIVGFFKLGWLSGLTGWGTVSGIALVAPVLFISIAFGLAMDYSVFLYSRMREVYDATIDPKKAIQQGVIKTGPIITAAALALFVVVAAFAGSSILFMKIIGVGLAAAVLVDAFFVRLILVPSIMTLMGKISWYAPRWLPHWNIKHK